MSGVENKIWKLLKDWDIPVLPTATASSIDEAVFAAGKLGYPVALKILSKDISHKSDAGGVILDLGSDEAVEQAYQRMMDSAARNVPGARIQGVTVQKMAEPGIEVIVGAKLDPQFGHVIMFGLGGIFVEICRDVSFRIIPVDEQMAREMILEIRGSGILKGARGQKPADIGAIIDVITRLSDMLEKNPGITEMDINPLIVYPRGAVAVDARMLAK